LGIHTLHLEHVVLLGLITILTVANSSLYKGMKGIHWFSLYNVCALLGALAVALRGQIPNFASIVGGNLLVIAGYFLLFFSVYRLFGGRKLHVYVQVGLTAAGAATMLQYGWLHPNTGDRLLAYSIVLGLQQAHVAWIVFRKQDGTLRFVGSSLGIMVGALALANLVRIAGVLYQGAPAEYLEAGPFLAWIVIVNSCLQCGAMVGYVWMTAGMLRLDLEVLASTDPLTGVLNRRAMEAVALHEMVPQQGVFAPVSAIVVDLDRFKETNDTQGHACGDRVLIAVAARLKEGLGAGGYIGRLGGDEFMILLPETSLVAAQQLAERLRTSLEEMDIAYRGCNARVMASFGVAQGAFSDWKYLLMRCDEALYEAKRGGGNRVVQMEDPDDAVHREMVS